MSRLLPHDNMVPDIFVTSAGPLPSVSKVQMFSFKGRDFDSPQILYLHFTLIHFSSILMKIYLLAEQIKFNTHYTVISSCEIVDIKFYQNWAYCRTCNNFHHLSFSLLSNPFSSFGGGVCIVFFKWVFGILGWVCGTFERGLCIWDTTSTTSACSSFFPVPQLWWWGVCYVKVNLAKGLCAFGILGWVYGTLGHI